MEGEVPESVVSAMETGTASRERETRAMGGEGGIRMVPFKLITHLSSILYCPAKTYSPFLEESSGAVRLPFPRFALYKRAGIDEHEPVNL